MSMQLTRRNFVAGTLACALGAALAGCAGSDDAEAGAETDVESAEATATAVPATTADAGVTVRVASLKGPTTIGLVQFMDAVEDGTDEAGNAYEFTIAASADQIVPSVISGDLDVALIPANVASVLYNKTEGGVQVIDINTLGVLNVVTGDPSIEEFADLAGKTVYMTGKGATPEYAMSYLLAQAGIADAVTLEFKSEATEVVSALAADASAVGVLPEPYKTVALSKNDALVSPINLTDVWDEYAGDTGSRLLTGVTVVRAAFAEENPQAVAAFLAGHAASVKAVNADPATWSESVAELGIIDSAAVAEKAIPGCMLVCETGDVMQAALSGYLQVLYDADASSVGGALPGDDFYYGAE